MENLHNLTARVAVLEQSHSELRNQRVAERLAALETDMRHTAAGIDRVEKGQASLSARINGILVLLVTVVLAVAGWVISGLGN